jgi:hypothetical protein
MGELARRNFMVVRENAATFGVIDRIRRKGAAMALVIPQVGYPNVTRILGVITKEHIAGSATDSIALYARE